MRFRSFPLSIYLSLCAQPLYFVWARERADDDLPSEHRQTRAEMQTIYMVM